MKIILVVTACIAIAFILFQSFIGMSTRKTEMRKYAVLEKNGNFEIRYYPDAVLATIGLKETSYKETASRGFRKLAGYIFGGNESNTSIAMTSPVEMSFSDTGSTMSFTMPSSYRIEQLPAPDDPAIRLHVSEKEYVAVISFGGFSSDADIRFYTEKLEKELNSRNIKIIGNYRYLGYNPPYEIFGRRNEIAVLIDYKQP